MKCYSVELTQVPGYHEVDSSGFDPSVGADGRHGHAGQECDRVAQGDDDESLNKASFTNDPSHSQEQHNAPE